METRLAFDKPFAPIVELSKLEYGSTRSKSVANVGLEAYSGAEFIFKVSGHDVGPSHGAFL